MPLHKLLVKKMPRNQLGKHLIVVLQERYNVDVAWRAALEPLDILGKASIDPLEATVDTGFVQRLPKRQQPLQKPAPLR